MRRRPPDGVLRAVRVARSDGRRAQAAPQQAVPQLERRLVRRVPLAVPDLDRVELLNRVPVTPTASAAQRRRVVDRDERAEAVRARGDLRHPRGVAGAHAEVHPCPRRQTPRVGVPAVGRHLLAAHDEQLVREAPGARDLRVVARGVVVGDEEEVEVVVVRGRGEVANRPVAVAVDGVCVQVTREPEEVVPGAPPAQISLPRQQLRHTRRGRAAAAPRARANAGPFLFRLDDDFDFNVHARGRDPVEAEDDAPTARGQVAREVAGRRLLARDEELRAPPAAPAAEAARARLAAGPVRARVEDAEVERVGPALARVFVADRDADGAARHVEGHVDVTPAARPERLDADDALDCLRVTGLGFGHGGERTAERGVDE